MENEQKPNLETAIFHYWTRPQRPLQDLLGDDSRSPQYLKTDLVEEIIKLIYPHYGKGELTITPLLNEIEGGNVKTLDVMYTGNKDYLRRIYVELIDDKGLKPWKEYKVKATGTPNAIKETINMLTNAVNEKRLEHTGWITLEPPPIKIGEYQRRWGSRTRPVNNRLTNSHQIDKLDKLKPAY